MDNKEIQEFPVYKGLKKPFVFKGYKGKFIYYTGGGLLLSLIIGAIGTSFNIIFGSLAMILGVVATIFIVNHLQKTKGLFNKSKHNNILWLNSNKINLFKNKNEKG